MAGDGFAAIRRVRTEQPLLDQIPNKRLLNFSGFGDWLWGKEKMTCYFEPRWQKCSRLYNSCFGWNTETALMFKIHLYFILSPHCGVLDLKARFLTLTSVPTFLEFGKTSLFKNFETIMVSWSVLILERLYQQIRISLKVQTVFIMPF